jgi:hypothetical protein
MLLGTQIIDTEITINVFVDKGGDMHMKFSYSDNPEPIFVGGWEAFKCTRALDALYYEVGRRVVAEFLNKTSKEEIEEIENIMHAEREANVNNTLAEWSNNYQTLNFIEKYGE